MTEENIPTPKDSLLVTVLSLVLAEAAKRITNSDPKIVAMRHRVAEMFLEEEQKAAESEEEVKEEPKAPKEVARVETGQRKDGTLSLVLMDNGEARLECLDANQVLVSLVTSHEFWTKMDLFRSDLFQMIRRGNRQSVSCVYHQTGEGEKHTEAMFLWDLEKCLHRDGRPLICVNFTGGYTDDASAYVTIQEMIFLIGFYDDAYEKGLIEHDL